MKMNNKNKLPVALAMMLALINKALAYVYLIITIIIAIVVGIIVWQLIKLAKNIPGPSPTGKDITAIYLKDDPDASSGLIYYNGPPSTTSVSTLSAQINQAQSSVVSVPFNLQYAINRIDTNGPEGKLFVGTNLESSMLSNWVTNLNGGCSVTMIANGSKFRLDYPSFGAGTCSVVVLDSNTNTYKTIIEISTNLNSWESVFTNDALHVYSVEDYIDNNAPPWRRFYRLNISTNSN